MLYGLIVFIAFLLLGDFLSALLAWPVPGSVMGMLMLFGVLVVRRGISAPLKQSSKGLLPYLPLFIVPASVGIVNYMDVVREEGLIIVTAMIVSLAVGIPLCGWLAQKTMSLKSGGRS
ncbi:MAG: putative effector of murein hydrolase LrgA (UPF0299 family) [Bermanella sp.]|jgi:putative effector of murein hydrolase LrgA (UPF0299 family)